MEYYSKKEWLSILDWEYWSSDGEGTGNPLQYSCLENPTDGGAWWAAVHGVAKSQKRPSDFPFTFHFHALEKEMATDSSVLAWRIPGAGEPGGLPSMGSHRVGHDWWDLAAAAAAYLVNSISHPEEGSCSLGCWGQTFFVAPGWAFSVPSMGAGPGWGDLSPHTLWPQSAVNQPRSWDLGQLHICTGLLTPRPIQARSCLMFQLPEQF